ncbi:hypothetical protein GCM10010310_28650 [Streptomyces violaceolatus]|uniref:Uncharacterized protein n=1 Tax=Streptomyces violaceolatus TaxID=67378 RepID=A0ABN3SPH1_9ACTN
MACPCDDGGHGSHGDDGDHGDHGGDDGHDGGYDYGTGSGSGSGSGSGAGSPYGTKWRLRGPDAHHAGRGDLTPRPAWARSPRARRHARSAASRRQPSRGRRAMSSVTSWRAT